jgi:hypothetical protein
LLKDVKSETSGNFGLILVALLIPRIEYEAHELRTAIVVGFDNYFICRNRFYNDDYLF